MDVSQEDLEKAGHVKGPKCRCIECGKLKDLEDKWILKMGRGHLTAGMRFNPKQGSIGGEGGDFSLF